MERENHENLWAWVVIPKRNVLGPSRCFCSVWIRSGLPQYERRVWKVRLSFYRYGLCPKRIPRSVQTVFCEVSAPPTDNKLAALNSAVWSGGTFIYVPKGVKVDVPFNLLPYQQQRKYRSVWAHVDYCGWGSKCPLCYVQRRPTKQPPCSDCWDLCLGWCLYALSNDYPKLVWQCL